MLDIHPPHHAATTWRDFFIHIATITIGLFIAIGLEQTVEAVHHLHQRHELEEHLREELRGNVGRDEVDFVKFGQMRAYFLELKSAVSARRTGQPSPPSPPAASDTRRQQVPFAPSVAMWEAAKLDATITQLPTEEIQLYNGLVLQHNLMFDAIDDFQHGALALESFEERFVDSPGAFDLGYPAPPPNLDAMSPAELAEYDSLIAGYIKAIDRLLVRVHFYDRAAHAILDGATNRDDLYRRAFPNQAPPPLPSAAPVARGETP
jgi:hypothetical protein